MQALQRVLLTFLAQELGRAFGGNKASEVSQLAIHVNTTKVTFSP